MLKGLFKKTVPPVSKSKRKKIIKKGGFFSTDYDFFPRSTVRSFNSDVMDRIFQRPMQIAPISMRGLSSGTMDDVGTGDYDLNVKFSQGNFWGIPEAQVAWYAAQSFIGYQMCAILSQHWLVNAACTVPAKDAVRKGFEITSNDGADIPNVVFDEMKRLDKKYELRKNMIEFVRFGRIFGVRHAFFEVDSPDPLYYEKPFNPDGVRPGSYRGISQVDPYWLVAQLGANAASNPASKNFYEPDHWQIAGRRVHKSHLIKFTTGDVPDILKPTYFWGGVPLTQQIYERVYAAERTANEAPLLALTKRTDVIKIDMTQARAQGVSLWEKFRDFVFNRNNYGVKAIDLDEEMQQFDTSLADFDNVMMSQYQVVSAISQVPAVKLLGTSPKGFNATGEYEEANYHEFLETLQNNDLTPLIQRHHLLVMLSEIAPKYGFFKTDVEWKPLDSMTAKEVAEVKQIDATTDETRIRSGVVSPQEARDRVIKDSNSGYNGIPNVAPDFSYEDDEDGADENSPREFGTEET